MLVALLVLTGALAALAHVTTVAQVMAQAVAMGVAGGFVMVVFFSFWGRAYGQAHLGRIQGAAQALTVLASAVGPLFLASFVETTRLVRGRLLHALGPGRGARRGDARRAHSPRCAAAARGCPVVPSGLLDSRWSASSRCVDRGRVLPGPALRGDAAEISRGPAACRSHCRQRPRRVVHRVRAGLDLGQRRAALAVSSVSARVRVLDCSLRHVCLRRVTPSRNCRVARGGEVDLNANPAA